MWEWLAVLFSFLYSADNTVRLLMRRKVKDDIVSHSIIPKKLKQNEDLCDAMDLKTDENPTEVLIDSKGKSKLVSEDIFENHSKSIPGSLGSDNITNSNSDLFYRYNGDYDDDDEEEEEEEDYGDTEYYYEDDDADYDYDDDKHINDDDYLAIQSHFDNVDLPTGVEVSVPWLKVPTGTSVTENKKHASGVASTSSSTVTKNNFGQDLPGASETKSGVASTSSSEVTSESSSSGDTKEREENVVIVKFKNFKQFDTVEDFSDHHYNKMGFSEQQPPKKWAKKIQDEWKILEKDLPETISVRVYEARMELLRAIIVGPAGTPYHDGLFVFDCLFPPNYPDGPPMVYYYSGGLRLNPNLYECGKVCLSLLGTWSGRNKDENWIPGKSTMLQVLVSIQALILNAEPYFNEPGYESSHGQIEAQRLSNKYSEGAFIMSLKTMVYTLRRPPKYFEDYVIGHFHTRANDILVACKAYLDGYKVGSIVVKDGVADVSQGAKDTSSGFRQDLRKMINLVVTNFSRFGSIDCERFRIDDS